MKQTIKLGVLVVASVLLASCENLPDFFGTGPDYSYKKAPPPPSDAYYYQQNANDNAPKSTHPTPPVKKTRRVVPTKTSTSPIVPATVPSIVPAVPTTAPTTNAVPTTAPAAAPLVAPSVTVPIVNQ